MDANEQICTWLQLLWEAMRADPAFQKLCEEKQP
jgi:hypothetical protein